MNLPDRPTRTSGRPPTLREIAERAGVHVSTASRVLRQPEPADGWSDAALRVREVAVELGYQPNLWAASLRTRKTTTLGVVMPRLTDGVVATMFQGIEETATQAGYSVLLSSPPDDLDAQRRAIEFLVSRQVDGLLLSSLHSP
ncbi:LacI family DNA-binding transcriptional regulator, partial [Streptomyces sp. NPDC058171]